MRKAYQRGFTLIELSIVLVIIGLIVGGVMVGRDLIRSAQVRAVLTQIEQFNTAVNTFHNKYNCLPGDCANATQFWGAADCAAWSANGVGTQTCNGNGDGVITDNGAALDYSSGAATHYERFSFWQQLTNAGMIAGNFTMSISAWPYNYPTLFNAGSPLYGSITPVAKISASAGYDIVNLSGPANAGIFFPGVSGNAILLGSYDSGSSVMMDGAITPEAAFGIDSKMDDGLPGSGIVMSQINTSYRNSFCATTNSVSTALYSVGTGNLCSPIFLVKY